VDLPGQSGWSAVPERATTDGSRVHCCLLDRGGAWLCPSGLAVPTPQTFSTASLESGFTNPEEFSTNTPVETHHSRPRSARFEPV